jgi:hypothetical protein
MPTYRTDAATTPGATPELQLVCEQCGAVVGHVPRLVAIVGLSVPVVGMLWHQLRAAVTRHEAECRDATE